MFVTLLTPEDDGTDGVPAHPSPVALPQQPVAGSVPVPPMSSPADDDSDGLDSSPAEENHFGLIDLGDEDLDVEEDGAPRFEDVDIIKFNAGEKRVVQVIRQPLCACGTHFGTDADLLGRNLCLRGTKLCPLCDALLGRLDKTVIWPAYDITGGNIPIYIEASAPAEWIDENGKKSQRVAATKGSKYAQLAAIMRKVPMGGTAVIEISRVTSMRYEITPRIIAADLLPDTDAVARFVEYITAHRSKIIEGFITVRSAEALRQIPVVKRALSLNGVP